MSLRTPLTRDVTLPDGRVVHVRVGVAEDGYIPAPEMDTVTLELSDGATASTSPSSYHDARRRRSGRRRACAPRDDRRRASSRGALAPTAGAIEPLADRLRRR